ncbi:unnamed protein product [Ectocarpus sp. 12 AP-2014]
MNFSVRALATYVHHGVSDPLSSLASSCTHDTPHPHLNALASPAKAPAGHVLHMFLPTTPAKNTHAKTILRGSENWTTRRYHTFAVVLTMASVWRGLLLSSPRNSSVFQDLTQMLLPLLF